MYYKWYEGGNDFFFTPSPSDTLMDSETQDEEILID
jgi:hypothetical protein